MARHQVLSGTSPASTRNATPPVTRQGSNAAAGPRRSSIVPFTRPGSGNSEDAGPGSFKSGEDSVQRMGQSLQQRRRSSVSSDWEGRSAGEAGVSLAGLKRPERRSTSLQFTRGNGFVRMQGFEAEEGGGAGAGEAKTSPRPPVAPAGLLSRQFSSDTLQPTHAVLVEKSAEQLKVSRSSWWLFPAPSCAVTLHARGASLR